MKSRPLGFGRPSVSIIKENLHRFLAGSATVRTVGRGIFRHDKMKLTLPRGCPSLSLS